MMNMNGPVSQVSLLLPASLYLEAVICIVSFAVVTREEKVKGHKSLSELFYF